jgi:hypothetical protein
VLLGEHRADEADDRGAVGPRADHRAQEADRGEPHAPSAAERAFEEALSAYMVSDEQLEREKRFAEALKEDE